MSLMMLLGVGGQAAAGGAAPSTFIAFGGHLISTATDIFDIPTTGVVGGVDPAAGDLLIMMCVGGNAIGSQPTFTLLGSGSDVPMLCSNDWTVISGIATRIFAKVLTSAEVTSHQVQIGNGETWGVGVAMFVYRGGTALTRKGFYEGATGGGVLDATGYAQAGGSVLALISIRTNDNSTAYSLVPPSPFVKDVQHSAFDGSVLDFSYICNSAFSAPGGVTASTYEWTGFLSDHSPTVTILELV